MKPRLPIPLLCLLLVALAGCSGVPKAGPARHAVLSVAPMVDAVVTARREIGTASASTRTTATALDVAGLTAAAIFRAAPVDLRPQVEKLQRELTTARTELSRLEATLMRADVALRESEEKAGVLQKQLANQADDLNRAEAALSMAEARCDRLEATLETTRKARNFLGSLLAAVVLAGGLWVMRKPLLAAVL